jgi:hypothetical protein
MTVLVYLKDTFVTVTTFALESRRRPYKQRAQQLSRDLAKYFRMIKVAADSDDTPPPQGG